MKSAIMLSVVAVPVAEVVTIVAQVPDVIALVPKADVPLATVPLIVEGKETPLVFVQVIAFDPEVVQSPLISDAEAVPDDSRRMPVKALASTFRPP